MSFVEEFDRQLTRVDSSIGDYKALKVKQSFCKVAAPVLLILAIALPDNSPTWRKLNWTIGVSGIAAVGYGLFISSKLFPLEPLKAIAKQIANRHVEQMADSFLIAQNQQYAAMMLGGSQQYAPPPAMPSGQQYYEPEAEYEEVEREYDRPQTTQTEDSGNYDFDYSYQKDEFEYFDWKLFDEAPDDFPHIAIVGGTGEGKSFTAEHISAVLGGLLIVVHPHRKPGDYPNVKAIHAGGRNYGDWEEDEEVSFKDLVDPSAGKRISFASVIKTLYLEMDRRFKLYEKGNFDYPMVNIILDEFNTSVAEVPEVMVGKGKGSTPIKKMIREARKVKIRFFFLLQDDSVEAMYIKGEGQLRKCLTYIRLGKFARRFAKLLKDEKLIDWTHKQKRPILVEEVPATIKASSEPSKGSREPEIVEPASQQRFAEVPEGSEPDEPTEISEEEWQNVANLKRSGKPKKEIIQLVWGAKKGGGKAYKLANQKYEFIVSQLEGEEEENVETVSSEEKLAQLEKLLEEGVTDVNQQIDSLWPGLPEAERGNAIAVIEEMSWKIQGKMAARVVESLPQLEWENRKSLPIDPGLFIVVNDRDEVLFVTCDEAGLDSIESKIVGEAWICYLPIQDVENLQNYAMLYGKLLNARWN